MSTNKPKTFLGKHVPQTHQPKQRRKAQPWWFAALVLPVVIGGGLLFMQGSTLHPATTDRETGGALQTTLASISAPATITLGDVIPVTPNPCTDTLVRSAFLDANGHLTSFFPLIPDAIRNPSGCTIAWWTRSVAYLFVYKALAMVNWIAGALAIIFTMYGGLLYISGFANEGNVKKAKTLLIATYSGLVIVFLARFMVYSAINLFTTSGVNNALNQNPITGTNLAP